MTRDSKRPFLAVSLGLAAVLTLSSQQPTLAQGLPGGRPSINIQAFNACTTTDYGAIAAKALNMTVVDVRKAIVNGQSVQQIATAANVPLQTVTDAVQAARKIDIDQAVKDGVITQDEATSLEATPAPAGTAPVPNGTRPAPGPNGPGNGPGPNGPRPAPLPDISNMNLMFLQMTGTPSAPGAGPRVGAPGGGFGGFGLSANIFNLVKQYVVAAQTINTKCPDLVKTVITPPGQSIAAFATAQKADPQAVIDAVTKAYKDALAQDVSDGVITQAQSDQVSATLSQNVAAFINNGLPMGVQATPAQ